MIVLSSKRKRIVHRGLHDAQKTAEGLIRDGRRRATRFRCKVKFGISLKRPSVYSGARKSTAGGELTHH